MDMPMKKKRRTVASQAAARGPLPEQPKELLDQLVNGPMTPAEVQDFVLAFNKAVIERAMGAEINLHLGYPPGQPKQFGQVDERNGASGKTVITDRVPVRVEVPRDRDGSFEPILIPKHDRGGLDAAKCVAHAQAECRENPERLRPHRHFLYRSRRIQVPAGLEVLIPAWAGIGWSVHAQYSPDALPGRAAE
jgi:hypothetical protein